MDTIRLFIMLTVFLLIFAPITRGVEQGAAVAPEVTSEEAAAKVEEPELRDPFRPFNLSLQPMNPEPPKTPLEQYELGSLTLVAVIWNLSSPKAMVEDDAGLGYTVSIGTPIGRHQGTVKAIEPNLIIVEEKSMNFFNEVITTEKVLELQDDEGEN